MHAADPLRDAKLRIDRAERHLSTLNCEMVAYADDQPYELVIQDKSNPEQAPTIGYTVTVELGKVRPFPDAWAILVGEIAYNLRCALEYTARQLVIARSTREPVTRENRQGSEPLTEFPIRERPTPYDRKKLPAPRLIHPFTDRAVEAAVDALQPNKRQDPASHELSVLKRLNDADKHHAVGLLYGVAGESTLTIRFPNGQTRSQRGTMHRRHTNGTWVVQRAEPGTVLGVFTGLVEWQMEAIAQHEVKVDSDIKALISLSDISPDSDATAATHTLKRIIGYVRNSVLGSLEPLLS